MRKLFGLSGPLLLLVFVTGMVCSTPAHAASEAVLDAAALAQLELRAQTASPRERCFLYAEIVHQLTETAGRQIAEGDSEHASVTLQRIDVLAQKIHISVASDTKRLKDAELLLHATTHHLGDIMRVSASDDRERVMATLKRLDDVHNEILAQVFAH